MKGLLNKKTAIVLTVLLLLVGCGTPEKPEPREKSSLRIGLALGGGGAKGLSHIAFIKALDEMGLKPSIIAGTSIGAALGAFYASGMSGLEIENKLEEIEFLDIAKMFDVGLLTNPAMLKGNGVEEFLYENIPVRRFEELEIPLKIVAADFWRREQVVFDSGEIVPAIRASISLPALFVPVLWKDTVLIDGGAVNPLPYDIIREQCDVLIAIDVSGEKRPPADAPMPDMFESILSSFQIMQASIVSAKMENSRPDIYIKPSLENFRILEFYRYDEIMEGVKADVERFKSELDKTMRKAVRQK